MNIWISLTGDGSLIWRKEKGNEYDPHAVAFTGNSVVVAGVPQNICDRFWKFLCLPKTLFGALVLGKRVNRGVDYGFEISVFFFNFSRPYQRNSMDKSENPRCREKWFNLALKMHEKCFLERYYMT